MSSGDPTTPRFTAPFGQSDAAAPTSGGTPGRPLSPRQTLVLATICGAFGIIAWGFYLWAFSGDPGQDWMVFYTAARAYFDGNLPLIFDGETLTAALNQRFAGWLATSTYIPRSIRHDLPVSAVGDYRQPPLRSS